MHPNVLHFDIGRGNKWVPAGSGNATVGYAGLPIQLLPYVAGTEVFLDRVPDAGYWQTGQKVMATDVTKVGTVGWVCVEMGEPGAWRPITE